jgi:hypothetical protein
MSLRLIATITSAMIVCITNTSCAIVNSLIHPPPAWDHAYVIGASDALVDNSSGCGDTVTTPFMQWTDYFSDGSSRQAASPYHWYAPSGQTGTLYIYTGVIDSTLYQQPTSDAIESWYTALNSRIPNPNHYLRLVPGEDTQNYQNDLVQVDYENDGYDYTRYANTAFGVVNGPGSIVGDKHGVSGGYIAGAQIMIHQPPIQRDGFLYNSTFLYRLSLHEIGHVLGLDHDAKKGNIMFTNAAFTNCYSYGQLPSLADTSVLESYYDPRINSDEVQNCTGHTCPQFATRAIPKVSPVHPKPEPALASPNSIRPLVPAIRRGANPNRPSVEAFMRSLAWYHGPNDGFVEEKRLSPESLLLSSSLAVRVRALRDVAQSRRGALPSVVTHEFAIESVISDLGTMLGDSSVKTGDRIYVDEQMAYEDIPFTDDPPVPQGERAVLFLRPVYGRWARIANGHHVYQYTAQQVSKWTESADGRLGLAAVPQSRIARAIGGRKVSDVFRSTRFAGLTDARTHALAVRRASLARIVAQLRGNPTDVLLEQAAIDGARNFPR